MDKNFTLEKVDQISSVSGKWNTMSGCMTARTDFLGGIIGFHVNLKK